MLTEKKLVGYKRPFQANWPTKCKAKIYKALTMVVKHNNSKKKKFFTVKLRGIHQWH